MKSRLSKEVLNEVSNPTRIDGGGIGFRHNVIATTAAKLVAAHTATKAE
jgi:hypothetical protein